MGWLGYTEQETRDTSIPALWLGYEGRTKMVLAMQGISPEQAVPVEPPSGAAVMAQMRSIFGNSGKPQPR